MELRVHIDGDWTAEEFSEFFGALQSLSYMWGVDMEYRFASPRASQLPLSRLTSRNATLYVKRIIYASPGFTDVAGFGAILSEIRQFLEFLINHIARREERKLDLQLKQLDVLQKKIALMEELKNSNLSHSVVKLIEARDVDALVDAIADGRVTKVEEIV